MRFFLVILTSLMAERISSAAHLSSLPVRSWRRGNSFSTRLTSPRMIAVCSLLSSVMTLLAVVAVVVLFMVKEYHGTPKSARIIFEILKKVFGVQAIAVPGHLGMEVAGRSKKRASCKLFSVNHLRARRAPKSLILKGLRFPFMLYHNPFFST